MEMVDEWLISLVGESWYWVIEVFVVVLVALLLGYLVNRIVDKLEEHAARTPTVWDDAFIEAFRKPVVWLIWVLGVNLGIEIASNAAQSEWRQFVEPINRIAWIWLTALFALNFISRAEKNFINAKYRQPPADETTAKAVGRLLRVAVIITAVLITMQDLGYSVSGLLAFGGVGGIAVGFAAKDLLANFFGGMMIYFDRPFKVGDWVRSPDQEIEGTVEDIGWRMTRIRTFDKRPLYIPNSVFTHISIENPSRMTNRRIYEHVGIRYDDMAKMAAITKDVKHMLQQHDEIDQKQTMIVNFNKFSASSIDFFIYTFTKTTEWIRYHEIKEDVLLRVARIITDHGAEIAFPTATVHVPDELKMLTTDKTAGVERG